MKGAFVFLFFWLILAASPGCSVSRKTAIVTDRALVQQWDRNFADAAAQYKLMMGTLPAGRFPKTYDPRTGKAETSNSSWWCSGFYPGTLLLLYEQTKDTVLYSEAMRMLQLLEKEQFNTGTHDLGFMMYCSYGNALRIAPREHYHQLLVNSAKSLSTRFNPAVGCIKSWNSKPSDFLVIIDNMMNLELLFWATQFTGDSSYFKIAVTHANTTMRNHFRPDYSSYHVVNYHPETGAVHQKRTAQGAADSSAWARGQVWGLYGYVATYRETGNQAYLDQALAIAQYLLQHPALPADYIPYWDFHAPEIPNALRDASAAAIMASALLELCRYTDAGTGRRYFKIAESILRTLSSDAYKAKPGTNGGFILQHGVGHKPAGTEVDVPLTYGDYYFVEAMKRYKEFGVRQK